MNKFQFTFLLLLCTSHITHTVESSEELLEAAKRNFPEAEIKIVSHESYKCLICQALMPTHDSTIRHLNRKKNNHPASREIRYCKVTCYVVEVDGRFWIPEIKTQTSIKDVFKSKNTSRTFSLRNQGEQAEQTPTRERKRPACDPEDPYEKDDGSNELPLKKHRPNSSTPEGQETQMDHCMQSAQHKLELLPYPTDAPTPLARQKKSNAELAAILTDNWRKPGFSLMDFI